MKRRDFIRTSCISCITGGAFAVALQSCSSAYYAQNVSLKQNELVIKKSEFIEIKKEKKNIRTVIVAKYEKLGFPIALFRLSDDQYTAIYLECTH